MLTDSIDSDIDILCGHCYEKLCTVKSQSIYEKAHDTCIFCGKRLLLILSDP
ncbi:hypothetical protein LCGC14_0823760 [marine sediment metagenome]|uniref:Uncharacterized protein n=1 Tax=marine sediment metagenome TaxID=412755 RepID=A0A0F9SQL3_9ZZZZ